MMLNRGLHAKRDLRTKSRGEVEEEAESMTPNCGDQECNIDEYTLGEEMVQIESMFCVCGKGISGRIIGQGQRRFEINCWRSTLE